MSESKREKKIKQAAGQRAQAKYQALASGDPKGFAKRFAMQHSPYLQTLIDPFNVTGVKVPDANTTPSFTFQTISKISISSTTGAGGNVGTGIFFQVGATSANGVSKWIPSATTLDTYGAQGIVNSTTWYTQLASNCMMTRPVSVGLAVSGSAATQTDGGRMFLAYLPPGEGTITGPGLSSGNLATAQTAFRQATYSVDVPVSKRFARVVWLPIDEIARSYMLPGASLSGGAPRPPNGTTTYGCLAALVDGCTTGMEFEFTIAVNWEGIPISSLTNILQASPSASDPLELAAASNVISQHPNLSQVQVSSETASGTAFTGGLSVKPGYDGPSFLDKVMGGLAKGFEVAKTMAPAVQGALALL